MVGHEDEDDEANRRQRRPRDNKKIVPTFSSALEILDTGRKKHAESHDCYALFLFRTVVVGQYQQSIENRVKYEDRDCEIV